MLFTATDCPEKYIPDYVLCSVEKECKFEDPYGGIWSQVFKYHKMRNSMSIRRFALQIG